MAGPEVEEDPCSQFVDFTNATALEQFVSDLEQALLGWQLGGKGHASPEALAAATEARAARFSAWTRVVGFSSANYTLSLFVGAAEAAAVASGEEASRDADGKKWKEGSEHFTPTMLALADASRDFSWCGGGEAGEDAPEELAYDADDAVVSRATVVDNARKWFGVDEFLLLTRATQRDVEKTPTTQKVARAMSSDSVDLADGVAASMKAASLTDTGAAADSSSAVGADGVADAPIDQNEAGLLLSALTIALNNCNCTIPAFVPVFEPSKGTWIGSAVPGETGNVAIALETDSVPELNPNQSCISGLLDFFKQKLQLPPRIEEKCRLAVEDTGIIGMSMTVSASFGYHWTRSEDPRDDSAVDTSKHPAEWLEFLVSTHKQQPSHIQQISNHVFSHRMTPNLGPPSSPVTGMKLKVGWPNLREGTYVDNVVHSTLDPQTAPDWTLKIEFHNLVSENARKPQLALSKMIANLVQAYSNSKELSKDILVSELAPNINDYPPSSTSSSTSVTTSTPPPSVGKESSTEGASSSRLSESIPSSRAAAVIGSAIGSIISAATWKAADVEEIRRTITEIFDQEELLHATNDNVSSSSAVAHGAPVGQLVSIIACRMGHLHGINSMALLWVEFVKGLRERWFQHKLLPFMSTAGDNGAGGHSGSSTSLSALFLLDSETFQLPKPDFHQCLLHQKLQLLNCCILREAEVARSQRQAAPAPSSRSTMSELTGFTLDEGDGDNDEDIVDEVVVEEVEGGSPSDDEFFDTVEQRESPRSTSHQQPKTASTSEGGLGVIPGVVCLRTNTPMIEPATQIAVPMTEDVAKQQQDLLTRLGVSLESAMLRQQIQSTVLISDMQAFKAANPGSCLVDFIRWYSPKDWIAFDDPLMADQIAANLPPEGKDVWWFEKQGMLSDRMRFGPSKEHIWQHMWETSPPVPASRQKPLFDPVQESEKLFHYLETMSPHEMLHQALAGAISGAFFALDTALLPVPTEKLPVVHGAIQELRAHGNRAIAMLDEALAESEVAFPAGQKDEQDRAMSQMQVAFEMALDACWKLVRGIECVEALVSNALGLFQYFEAAADEALELINLLLLRSLPAGLCKDESSNNSALAVGRRISQLLKAAPIRARVASIVLANPSMAGPVEREYILRCVCPRPFLRDYHEESEASDDSEADEDADAASVFEVGSVADGRFSSTAAAEMGLEASPLVVNRMYAAFRKNTVRFALALAEAEF